MEAVVHRWCAAVFCMHLKGVSRYLRLYVVK